MLQFRKIHKYITHINTFKTISKTFTTNTNNINEIFENLEKQKVPIYKYEEKVGDIELGIECRRLKLSKEGCISNYYIN